MTWLKLSDDFHRECARVGLSDAAYRTHVEALGWAMERETGGRITFRDLRRFAETIDPRKAVAELVAADLWQDAEDGWVISHHMEHQPEPDVLAKRRENNAERQRQYRRRAAGLDP